jgi:hypothetical protein
MRMELQASAAPLIPIEIGMVYSIVLLRATLGVLLLPCRTFRETQFK